MHDLSLSLRHSGSLSIGAGGSQAVMMTPLMMSCLMVPLIPAFDQVAGLPPSAPQKEDSLLVADAQPVEAYAGLDFWWHLHLVHRAVKRLHPARRPTHDRLPLHTPPVTDPASRATYPDGYLDESGGQRLLRCCIYVQVDLGHPYHAVQELMCLVLSLLLQP
jgi:hypothetical protein